MGTVPEEGIEMLWNRAELKFRAREVLSKNYLVCVLAAFVLGLMLSIDINQETLSYLELSFSSSFRVSIDIGEFLLNYLVVNILEIGICRFFVENRDYRAPLTKIFFGFRNGYYGRSFWITFVRDVKIFLWTLLLVIPGIVKSYEYSMIPYILAEQPDLSMGEAFDISRDMTDGQKWEMFVLDLSFLGWRLLTVVTLGLSEIFWTAPYYQAVRAELYAVLRNQFLAKYKKQKE